MCVWMKSDQNARYFQKRKEKKNIIPCLIRNSNFPLKNAPKITHHLNIHIINYYYLSLLLNPQKYLPITERVSALAFYGMGNKVHT